MNAHVQYAGEISPKKLRGFINVTSTVFLALGKTVARILGLRCLCYSSACCIFIFLLYRRGILPVLETDIHQRWGFICLTNSSQEASTYTSYWGFHVFPWGKKGLPLEKWWLHLWRCSLSAEVNKKRWYVNTLSKFMRSKCFANFLITSCRGAVMVKRAVVGIFWPSEIKSLSKMSVLQKK